MWDFWLLALSEMNQPDLGWANTRIRNIEERVSGRTFIVDTSA